MSEQLGPCEGRIVPKESFGWLHAYPCKKPGKVIVDGKCYCGIHDPERLAGIRTRNRAAEDRRSKRNGIVWDIKAQAAKVVTAARKAAHQESSWDEVADAVSELERLEAVLGELGI